MLQCLYEDGDAIPPVVDGVSATEALVLACEKKRSDIFFWIIFQIECIDGNTKVTSSVLNAALRNYLIDVAKWVREHTSDWWYSTTQYVEHLAVAYLASEHKMVEFLENTCHTFKPVDVWSYRGFKLLEELCAAGNLSTLILVTKKYKFNIGKDGALRAIDFALYAACKAGHSNIVRWLIKRFKLVKRIRSNARPTPIGRWDAFISSANGLHWYNSLKMATWLIGLFRLDKAEISVGIATACRDYIKEEIHVAYEIAKRYNLIDVWVVSVQSQITAIRNKETRLRAEAAKLVASADEAGQAHAELNRWLSQIRYQSE